MALHDVLAAFDMVDHDIILTTAPRDLLWNQRQLYTLLGLQSHLSGCTLLLEILELLGSWSNCEYIRVQSWVLSFTFYICKVDIPAIFSKHSSARHLYHTDYVLQVLVLGPPSDPVFALTGRIGAISLEMCTSGYLPSGYH